MKWQAYAERLEADLKMTDETLKTLKQENRDLQKKLIAAPTDVDAQMQLEKIKQEAKSYADSHVQKANDLQQQLVVAQHVRDAAITRATEAETGQQNVLEKLDAASHELEAKDAEIEQLRNELAAHTPSLLRAQQTFEAAKQKWEAAAESYEQRTKVLADQLQRQQKENARLLGLKEKKKPGQADEDEDDSEPEFPGCVIS